MTAIEDFEARVSSEIRRGTTYDSEISTYAQNAVKTLEKLENWPHMWTEEDATLSAAASTRSFTLLKTLYFVKRKLTDGTYVPLKKISSSQVLKIETGTPGGFWLSTNTPASQVVQLDRAPAEDTTLRWGYWSFSAYDSDLAWLALDPGLLVAQTILEMQPRLRNPKFAQMYGPVVQAKVQFLLDAKIDAEFAGQDQRMIPYADEMDEWVGTTDYDW